MPVHKNICIYKLQLCVYYVCHMYCVCHVSMYHIAQKIDGENFDELITWLESLMGKHFDLDFSVTCSTFDVFVFCGYSFAWLPGVQECLGAYCW